MRIGLQPTHAVEISSRRPFRIVDPATGKEVWRNRFSRPVRVVADGGPRDGVRSVYRVQVGAFGNSESEDIFSGT